MTDPASWEEPRRDPPRAAESADWRFAVLVLMILLLATLATGLVLYVQDDSFPEGVGNLASAVAGALIVIIGRRVI